MVQISQFTVRTSNRRVFRRCLRKWGFESSMRRNLQRKGTEQNINFWFGSGIHFALEDYFGYNRFGDPVRAFQAYYAAFPSYDRPEGADEHYYLGIGMLEYFKTWYARHNTNYGFQTVWLYPDGTEASPGVPDTRPLVEESFMLDLGLRIWVREDTKEIAFKNRDELFRSLDNGFVFYEESAGKFYILVDDGTHMVYLQEIPVYYHGTLDRVVKDRLGRWWIMDYKTAKGADTNKLETDDQISAYLWAAEQWFNHPIYGFMYVQLTKDIARPPKRLANGQLSVDKKQKTTYDLFRKALIEEYSTLHKAPKKYIDYLNWLASEETLEGDKFIRWDPVYRTREQKIATYGHIMAEVSMMIDPNLYLFPNPTRDCIWDCPFRDACIMIDKGQVEEAEKWLEMYFEPHPRKENGNIQEWRQRIPWPDTPQGQVLDETIQQLELDASQTLNLILPDKYLQDYEEDV